MEAKVNPTQAMILSVLADGDKTGSDIYKQAEAKMSGFWSTTRSQVYRELHVLHENKMVKPVKFGDRRSVTYKATAKGTRALKAWFNAEPGNDLMRNQMVLRLLFANLQSAEQIESSIKNAINKYESLIDDAEEQRHQAQNAGRPAEVAVLHFTRRYYETLVSWLECLDPRELVVQPSE
jgi:DNA-binding PadR family transcriptional regulator